VSSPVALALAIVLVFMTRADVSTAQAPTDVIDGGVNWTRQVMYGKGIGVVVSAAASNAQARGMAITAGATIARRELLGLVRGVRIDSVSTVQNAIAASSVVESRVSGVVQRAQLVEVRELGAGAVEVTVAMPITGEFAALFLPPGRPRVPRPLAPPAVIYTGLVIDTRGLGVKPAMAPRVVSEGGREVYGVSLVDRAWVIQQGMAAYSTDLPAAQAHQRVANRPLTIRAVAAAGANRTDVVVSDTDAQVLLGSGQSLAFLGKARVMMVVD
jgi:hypothetical protein